MVLFQGLLVSGGRSAQISRRALDSPASSPSCREATPTSFPHTHHHYHQQGAPAAAWSWQVGKAAVSLSSRAPRPAPPSGQDRSSLQGVNVQKLGDWTSEITFPSKSSHGGDDDRAQPALAIGTRGPGGPWGSNAGLPAGRGQVQHPRQPITVSIYPPGLGFTLGQRFSFYPLGITSLLLTKDLSPEKIHVLGLIKPPKFITEA